MFLGCEIHYADGRLVKDEIVTTPDYAIDGSTGDEIEFAIVKSGTARETLPAGEPPTDSGARDQDPLGVRDPF